MAKGYQCPNCKNYTLHWKNGTVYVCSVCNCTVVDPPES